MANHKKSVDEKAQNQTLSVDEATSSQTTTNNEAVEMDKRHNENARASAALEPDSPRIDTDHL